LRIEVTALLASCILATIPYSPNQTANIITTKKTETPIAVARSHIKLEDKNKFVVKPLTEEQVNNLIKDVTYNENLKLLSKITELEAGSSWLTDEQQSLVACVVLNRIKSPLFPNTLHDVIYQRNPIQYQSAWSKAIKTVEPSERVIKNVKRVLDGKFTCPSNVLFQSEKPQGDGIYKKFYNKYTHTTTYFCYCNK
jgi:spore germination cell wall hydrolase CwlJ-like protein